jgi:hypothetical protein
MKDLLRKGLDAYEGRRERRDDEFANLVIQNVDAMSHRATLKRYIYFLGGVNVILWAAVLLRPFDVLTAFNKIAGVDQKIIVVIIGFVFGAGTWLTYAIFRLKFPDLEQRKEGREVMTAFADQENSTRKTRVWLAAVVCGVLNLLALAITESLLTSN